MTKSQKALAVARQKIGGVPSPIEHEDEISDSMVRKAEAVVRSRRSLELCTQIEQGEITVNHAYESLLQAP